MNNDSDHSQDSHRRFSFTQGTGGLFGSPKDSFNVGKLFGDSKSFLNNIIKTKPQDIPEQQQIDDFNFFAGTRRARTQSVSSDISLDDQPMGRERRSSFSERFFTMQMQPKTANDKFNNFRSAITSYYD